MATVPQKPPVTHPAPAPAAKPKAQPRDAVREVVETVVFVIALVLMLKLFVVEAFVIPTGSMAETLYGYQKIVECPECHHEFPVNSSNEVDPWDGRKKPVVGCICPNCRYPITWRPGESPPNRSGDRVLVHKAVYEFGEPHRGHVVVFKFPVDPQVNHTAQNYIKRLWGLGTETLAIHRGDLYLCRDLDYPLDELDSFGRPRYPRPPAGEEDRLWEGPDVNRHSKTSPPYTSLGLDFTYHNADRALGAFEESRAAGFPGGHERFELIRKSDDLAMSMRRIVYHNDHQSAYLAKMGVPPRWTPDDGWKPDAHNTPRVFTRTGGTGWLHYLHRVPGEPVQLPAGGPPANQWQMLQGGWQAGLFEPAPITNFLGYNAGMEAGLGGVDMRQTGDYWVGDLMLECTAKVSGPGDEVVLELSKGVNRFQAKFAGGKVTVSRVGPGGREMATAATPITSGGSYALRFANFDCRLRVWVNGTAIDFGTPPDYSPSDAAGYETAVGALAGGVFAPRPDGHTLQNDVLAPAGIGATGNVEVSKIVLWEDTFFTPADGGPAETVDTFYVQPGHYLCLGDNSGQSSDSRKWGLVPKRLLLGRAVFVFFPFDRVGFIR